MVACQATDDGSIPFTRTMEMVKARLKVRKTAYGRTFEKDDIIPVHVLSDGRARIVTAASIALMPTEYELLIEDNEWDKLLKYGDMV